MPQLRRIWPVVLGLVCSSVLVASAVPNTVRDQRKGVVATRPCTQENCLPVTACPTGSVVGWNGNTSADEFLPGIDEALAAGGGDEPGLGVDKVPTSKAPPRLKKVFVLGKGDSAIPLRREPGGPLIATVNHALAWVNHSDIHFGLDWYFEEVNADFFCRASALVLPSYFHYRGSRHVHASVLLSKLNYDGLVFLVQLPDSPHKDPLLETWEGPDMVHSSGDLAFAWLLKRGYREFESWGIGGTGYAQFGVSRRYKTPAKFLQNPDVHRAQVQRRMRTYNATWVRH